MEASQRRRMVHRFDTPLYFLYLGQALLVRLFCLGHVARLRPWQAQKKLSSRPTITCCLPRLPAASHNYLLPPTTASLRSSLVTAQNFSGSKKRRQRVQGINRSSKGRANRMYVRGISYPITCSLRFLWLVWPPHGF